MGKWPGWPRGWHRSRRSCLAAEAVSATPPLSAGEPHLIQIVERRLRGLDWRPAILGRGSSLPVGHGRRLRLPFILALILIALLASSPSRPAQADGGFVYGMNIAGVSPWTLDLARQAGFPVVKVSLRWEQLQRVPGKFTWWT